LSEAVSKEARLLASKNIYIREFSFEQLVDLAFDQIYFWGKEDYIVVRHILKTITNLVTFMPSEDKLKVLIKQVEDFELQYLHTSPSNTETPFIKKEHRNSLRDHLAEYYEAVIEATERFIPMSAELENKRAQYNKYVVALKQYQE
jgi:hypothetical protein